MVQKIKIFIYNMLVSSNSDGRIKSLIDILVEKIIRKKSN